MFRTIFRTRIRKAEKQIQEEEKPEEKITYLGGTHIVEEA